MVRPSPDKKTNARPYHHGDLRRALLDATLAIAAEDGVTAVTLREAARRAGVSQTAPYRHFADKQAMLAAASQEGFELFYAELERSLRASGQEPAAELVSLGKAYIQFALDKPAHFRLMFGHGSPKKSSSPELQAAAKRAFQLFFGAFQRCLGLPAASAVVKDVHFRLWALAHGIASLALEKQILFDVEAPALMRAAHDAMKDLLAVSVASHRATGRASQTSGAARAGRFDV